MHIALDIIVISYLMLTLCAIDDLHEQEPDQRKYIASIASYIGTSVYRYISYIVGLLTVILVCWLEDESVSVMPLSTTGDEKLYPRAIVPMKFRSKYCSIMY